MKRMIISAAAVVAATAAFAAPAGAQDIDSSIAIAPIAPYPCYSWETYAQCAERISRNADDIVFDLVYDYAVPTAADLAGDVITAGQGALQTVRDLCTDVAEECDSALL